MSSIFLLGIRDDLQLRFLSRFANEADGSLDPSFAAESLERSISRPIEFTGEIAECRREVLPVTGLQGPGFVVKVSSDIHERVDADSFGDQVLPRIRPLLRQRNGDSLPEVQYDARRDL